MNAKLRPYMGRGQIAYSQIEKETGIPAEVCRMEIEKAWRILNPSLQIILYPERLDWQLID